MKRAILSLALAGALLAGCEGGVKRAARDIQKQVKAVCGVNENLTAGGPRTVTAIDEDTIDYVIITCVNGKTAVIRVHSDG